jgi:hypothetical protein
VAQRIQIAVDCADPDRLADFWAAALGYRLLEPPDGHSSWAAYSATQATEPGEAWSKIVDPANAGPNLLFHRVRETKGTKNRVHLDVRAPSDVAGDRQTQTDQFVDRLVGLGARKLHGLTDDAGYFV